MKSFTDFATSTVVDPIIRRIFPNSNERNVLWDPDLSAWRIDIPIHTNDRIDTGLDLANKIDTIKKEFNRSNIPTRVLFDIDMVTEYAYIMIKYDFKQVIKPSTSGNAYYCQNGKECIEQMKESFPKAMVEGFMILNVFKYVDRAPYKEDAVKDLDKALSYLDMYEPNIKLTSTYNVQVKRDNEFFMQLLKEQPPSELIRNWTDDIKHALTKMYYSSARAKIVVLRHHFYIGELSMIKL